MLSLLPILPMASQTYDWKRTVRGLAVLVALYLFVVYVVPRPASVKPEGWRVAAIFFSTILGLIIQPIPGGAVVLLGVTLAAASGGLTIDQALMGWASPTVWLVIAAFFMSRGLINCGLARRLALFFVRVCGKTTLGVCYGLSLSDMVLAAMIPSNSARSGGIILPIARTIAELYGSTPGATSALMGSFLITAVYQSICVTAAMFYTGQASNPLAAQIAGGMGYQITWASWLFAASVPGLVSMLVVPWVVMKLDRPQIVRTPEASAFAARELAAMGPLKRGEKILAVVFAAVCGLWVTSSTTHINITVTALGGGLALLLTGVLSWDDIKSERAAWDIFVWYGGVIRLGTALNEFGVTKAFAQGVSDQFSTLSWMGLLAVALLIYFYAHYAFASITTHILAMFAPFVGVLLAKGAPAGLTFFSFACFSNFAAGLTHYGTTPTPMFFASDYVSMKNWWKVGFVVSLANLAVWSTVGFAWWKLIGLW
jgi:DASS family divalent anion:Na+ symporter